jgi:predicted PurR-regulated permease PerM
MEDDDRSIRSSAAPLLGPSDLGLPYWLRRAGTLGWLLIGFLIAAGTLALLISTTSSFTTPIVIAACLAIVFAPASSWLVDRGVDASLAAIAVLVGLVGATALVAYLAAAAVVDQSDQLSASLSDAVDQIKTWLADTPIDPDLAQQVSDSVSDSGPRLASGLASDLVSVLNSVTGFVSGVVFALIVLYYLLKKGPAEAVAPPDPTDERATLRYRIAGDAIRDVRGYFRGQTALALMNGIVIGLAAAVLGVPAALAIGLVNFVGAYVPYLGGFVGGALAVLMALGDGGLGPAVAMLAVALFVNLVLENLLQPVLIGGSLDIGPLTILLVTTLGGMLAGMVGLVFAAPAWAIAVDVHRELRAARPADEPAT